MWLQICGVRLQTYFKGAHEITAELPKSKFKLPRDQ